MSVSNVVSLLASSPSVFHAVANMKLELVQKGFEELDESKPFSLVPGGKFFLTRNGSSIIAFIVPKERELGFRIAATHNDSPCFALKPNPVLAKGAVTEFNVEPYGGMIAYSWFDRPLSIAGRVFERVGESLHCHLVDIDEDLLVTPSLAIHQNREVNQGFAPNMARELVPLWLDGSYQGDFAGYLQKKLGLVGDIVSHDLFLYVREKPRYVGEQKNWLLCPRLDDLSSAYASLEAFLSIDEKEAKHIPVFVSFDNEEVGSLTAQGAHSDFLKNTLRRINLALGRSPEESLASAASSVLLSVDNAHANHPNYPEKADATTSVALNGGIVIKYHAEQRYTTNGASSAYVKGLCASLGDPYQEFTNRSDMRSGGTLGNISNAEVSLLSADIGIAQLAMHSSVELCGLDDIERMERLLAAHYKN